MLVFLDNFFFVFHAALVVFNLFGWMWRKTRRVHLVTITLTFGSWFGLGLWYGWGYCPCTDWHWQVKHARGQADIHHSCIKHYADMLTGIDWSVHVVDTATVMLALLALVLSITLNVRDWRRRRGSR